MSFSRSRQDLCVRKFLCKLRLNEVSRQWGRRPKLPPSASCSCISCSPTGARHVAQPRTDQHQGGVAIRERPHHARPPTDLTVQPLDHVVGTDAGPMLAGKIAVSQRFLCTIFSDIVCCLLSEWCVVTSFYQSLHAMSSFMRFSICATYCTLFSLMLQEL